MLFPVNSAFFETPLTQGASYFCIVNLSAFRDRRLIKDIL